MSIPIPIAALMIATTVLQTGASVMGQMSQQRNDERLRQQQIANATAASTANYDQINLRRRQERQAAGQQVFENTLDALGATSRFQVAADEAGVAGASIEGVLRDLYGREARFNDSVATNLEMTGNQLTQQGVQVQNSTASAINNAVRPKPVDWAGAVGGLVTGVANAYTADVRIGNDGGRTLFN